MARRLEKARGSSSERILATGFHAGPPKHLAPHLIWAWQGTLTDPRPAGWDQYHLILKNPKELHEANFAEFTKVVIQPQSKSDRRGWLEACKQIPLSILQEKFFLEFEPWNEQRPELMTVNEVVSFLYELRYHLPHWKPGRRPGVELWDARISESFELESSDWQETRLGYQAEATPDVSVVIPSFNNKYFVQNVIHHLGQQTLSSDRYEVIVVDDGGTDRTLEYLQLFGVPKNLQLRFVYWPRPQARKRGDSFFRAGLCRNLGVRLSRGHSLVFLDSDMLVPNHFLETVLKSLEASDVIQFPRWHVHQERSSGATRYESVKREDLYVEEEEYWKPFFENKDWMSIPKFWKYTCTYGLAMKKDHFLQAGRFCRFYVSYGFEDTELGYRLAQQQRKFQLVPVDLLHLTSYSTSEYQFSKKKRHLLLRRTAKQFFLSTLEIENFHHLQGLMTGEPSLWPRLKKALDFRDKNRLSGDS